MTRASFPCPRCGSAASLVWQKSAHGGKERKWTCPRCGCAFKTFEGIAVDGRHWVRGGDGGWHDTAEA